jgi:hypothetical protein
MNLIFNSIDHVNLLTINRLYSNFLEIKLGLSKKDRQKLINDEIEKIIKLGKLKFSSFPTLELLLPNKIAVGDKKNFEKEDEMVKNEESNKQKSTKTIKNTTDEFTISINKLENKNFEKEDEIVKNEESNKQNSTKTIKNTTDEFTISSNKLENKNVLDQTINDQADYSGEIIDDLNNARIYDEIRKETADKRGESAKRKRKNDDDENLMTKLDEKSINTKKQKIIHIKVDEKNDYNKEKIIDNKQILSNYSYDQDMPESSNLLPDTIIPTSKQIELKKKIKENNKRSKIVLGNIRK